MTLTQERALTITEFLKADEDRAKRLVALEPAEALNLINAEGNNFTVEELNEYADAVRKASEYGELDAEALDSVAGGDATVLVAAVITAGAIIVGNMISSRAW